MIKKQLKSLLSFTKKEFNGLLIFCFLLLLVISFPAIETWITPRRVFSTAEFKREIAEFRGFQENQIKEDDKEGRHGGGVIKPVISYFHFNPNDLSPGGWSQLGLSEKQIRVIENYLAKGGRVHKKEDLRKIYSISEDEYKRLAPYVRITGEKKDRYSYTSYRKREQFKKRPVVVELNSADSAQLESLPGIGPAFAARILRYRTRLGGFYHREQLKEVYGLDSLKYENLKDRVEIDEHLITRIDVNTATFDDLKRYPYLTYKQINAILQYRKQHGDYKSIIDLKEVLVLDDDILRKIAPYLKFND